MKRTPEQLVRHRNDMKRLRETNIEKQRAKEQIQREKIRADPEKHAALLVYGREYRKKHTDRLREIDRKKYKEKREDPAWVTAANIRTLKYYHQLRRAAFAAYGGKCACCGERFEGFLSIDHVNNDGAAHRLTMANSIYAWLKKNKYPPGFQTLCMNCNHAKMRYGGICPHQTGLAQIHQTVKEHD